MPIGNDVYYKIRRYPSGKRIKLTFRGDRIIERAVLRRASRRTKTGRKLARRRRRIGLWHR